MVGWWRTALGGANRFGLRLGARDLSGMTGSLDCPRVVARGDFGIVDGAIATTELEGSVALGFTVVYASVELRAVIGVGVETLTLTLEPVAILTGEKFVSKPWGQRKM